MCPPMARLERSCSAQLDEWGEEIHLCVVMATSQQALGLSVVQSAEKQVYLEFGGSCASRPGSLMDL